MSTHLKFKEAKKEDLEILVSMLADDDLGASREDITTPLQVDYINAFEAIDKDANNELVVAIYEQKIVGMLQLTYIPYLTHKGSWRCLVEGVRVANRYRGKGFGAKMFAWAIERAKEKKCSMIQLTSNKHRTQALKFYESLGFEASHEGFKLQIT